MSPSMGESIRRFLRRLGGRPGPGPHPDSPRTREPARSGAARPGGSADRDPTRSGATGPGGTGNEDPTDHRRQGRG